LAKFFNVSSLAALFICSSLCNLSSQVFATTLNVANNLIVSEINDANVNHGYIGNKSSFELDQGNHALMVRYKDVFEDLDFYEERVVESKDFVVKFTITDQKLLTLNTIKIKNLKEAEVFVQAPQLKLQDSDNNQLNISLEKVEDYKLAKQVDIAVSAFPQKSKVQLESSTKLAPVSKTINTSTQVNPLTMLKYWWNNASAVEKQLFKQFSSEN
jgi:uncharacterized protein YccT (UPF0319 family)